MNCRFCKEKVKSRLSGQDIHRKFKEWDCPNCGLIKNQFIIDGQVIREWNK